ncbi:MAG TPA: SIMPL domain-containing protein [Candidatus Baltobacteraceae bacterium]|nr:SIMPL domain-containing protein [Candidatus Baltobacteraceae bacterium]
MKRTTVVVVAALLLPSVAGAQPMLRGPISGPAPNAARGITVTGSASTRVPATSARITLQIVTANRALTLDTEKVQPIVDALVKAGADPASVRLPINFRAPGTSNVATITATAMHPTVAMLQSGIVTVGTAVASMKGVLLNSAQVFLSAADCQTALDSARERAIARAHAKAESIAKDLNVHIGGAINVQSIEQNTPDGSCSTQYFVNGMMTGPDAPQTPQDYVTVPVASTITITYAIK